MYNSAFYMDKVTVAGISIPLRVWSKDELKGLPVIYVHSHRFYDFTFKGNQMILLESDKHFTPLVCQTMASRIEGYFGRPIVFYFDKLLYYERKRYVEHGIYYISGDSNAFLPMLMASPVRKRKKAVKLSAAAQYLLMVHFQVESLDHHSRIVGSPSLLIRQYRQGGPESGGVGIVPKRAGFCRKQIH